jgi:hypothetical protein
MPNHNRGHKIDNVGEHWGSDTASSVLTTDSSGDVASVAYAKDAATANTFVQRDANGDVVVPATPTGNDGAGSKAYIDGGTYLDAALPANNQLPLKAHTYTITTDDMDDSDTSEAVDISTDDDGNDFPANALVKTAFHELVEVVAGGTISACTIEVGDAGTTDELIGATDVFTGATLGSTFTNSVDFETFEKTAYSPIATLAFTGGNSDTAESGQIKVHILYFDLADIIS